MKLGRVDKTRGSGKWFHVNNFLTIYADDYVRINPRTRVSSTRLVSVLLAVGRSPHKYWWLVAGYRVTLEVFQSEGCFVQVRKILMIEMKGLESLKKNPPVDFPCGIKKHCWACNFEMLTVFGGRGWRAIRGLQLSWGRKPLTVVSKAWFRAKGRVEWYV